jgi:callose synthase
LFQVSTDKEKEAARFAQLWNKIITSLREEDLIDNRYYYA